MNGKVLIGAASLIAAMANASAEESLEQASPSPNETTLATPAPDASVAPAHGGGFIFYPIGPDEGQQRWAVGGVWQVAPMFTANFRRGLGSGFTLDARATSIFVGPKVSA